MRYSIVDPSKAEDIVAEAVAGGVRTSNDDNAYVVYDGTAYVHAENNNLRSFSHFNYMSEPFVDQLKSTNDPRGKYNMATYVDPGAIVNASDPDTVLANQFGVPIGVDAGTITSDDPGNPYRGSRGSGLDYSQPN